MTESHFNLSKTLKHFYHREVATFIKTLNNTENITISQTNKLYTDSQDDRHIVQEHELSKKRAYVQLKAFRIVLCLCLY